MDLKRILQEVAAQLQRDHGHTAPPDPRPLAAMARGYLGSVLPLLVLAEWIERTPEARGVLAALGCPWEGWDAPPLQYPESTPLLPAGSVPDEAPLPPAPATPPDRDFDILGGAPQDRTVLNSLSFVPNVAAATFRADLGRGHVEAVLLEALGEHALKIRTASGSITCIGWHQVHGADFDRIARLAKSLPGWGDRLGFGE